MITCMKCREDHDGDHRCLGKLSVTELYSYESQLLGLKEMLDTNLQQYRNKVLTPARLAALRITAAEIIEKLNSQDQGNLSSEAFEVFEAIVAEAITEIFKLGTFPERKQ